MRFHSTPESVQNGEITQLAIIECFVAVAIYVGIGVYFRTFRHLAVAIALAPLTLLRTEASSRWGFQKYREASEVFLGITHKLRTLVKHGRVWALLFMLMAPILAVAGSVVRVVATMYWALRIPMRTLENMPQNWLRQSFHTDLFYPPEVVPLETVYVQDGEVATFTGFWGFLREYLARRDWRQFVGLCLSAGPFAIVSFLPPLFYRVSFKATSLAYYPLVWVANITLLAEDPIKTRLERITKGELEKTRRWVSGLVALALLTKIALVLSWIDVSAALAKFPSRKFVESLLVPNVWPWWQVTLGIDALVTFCLLYYADAALARLEGKGAWQEETITKTVSTAAFLRASLGIVTISHFFYVALMTVAAGHIKSPVL